MMVTSARLGDQQHLTIGLNDCLDGSHLETKSNTVGGIRNGE
jgi:hypothetical protein